MGWAPGVDLTYPIYPRKKNALRTHRCGASTLFQPDGRSSWLTSHGRQAGAMKPCGEQRKPVSNRDGPASPPWATPRRDQPNKIDP